VSRLDAAVARWLGFGFYPDTLAPVAEPAPDDWANPSLEEWASVSARVPVVLPKCGLPFLAEHEEAEDAVLAELAALVDAPVPPWLWLSPWEACQSLFTTISEGDADVA